MEGSADMRVYGLGPFRVEFNGGRLYERDWHSQKALQLFKILLVHLGEVVPTDRLLEELWPNLAEAQARRRLYDTVYRLRSVIDIYSNESYILKTSAGYCINPLKRMWLDWGAFRDIYEELQSVAADEVSAEQLEKLKEAIQLYRGAFMPSDLYQEWAQSHRLGELLFLQ